MLYDEMASDRIESDALRAINRVITLSERRIAKREALRRFEVENEREETGERR